MTLDHDPIQPDTKDWTWTTERSCDECGFDASAIAAEDLAPTLHDLAGPWPLVLTRPDVRQRPRPTTWSPLEYAAHVHEVLDVFAGRFELILAEEHPDLPNWDQDVAAIEGRYADRDPAVVSREILVRAEVLARVLERFSGEAWQRRARRSDGAEFTAEGLGRYLVHDLAHHLHDVGADRG